MTPYNDILMRRAIEMDITTFAELKSAIENANEGDILQLHIKNDLIFTSSVVITRSLTIHITNGSGASEVNLWAIGNNFRHFQTNPSGTATLADVPNLSITINQGVVLNGNNAAGGIGFFSSGGELILDGCSIIHCARSGGGVEGNGGGLWVGGNAPSCTLTMRDTLIADCMANAGGGVFINGGAVCIMDNGQIYGNTASAANANGGGVYVFASSASFMMNGGTISHNTATNGGGAFNLDGTFTMSGNAAIMHNTASNSAGSAGNGGGVFNSNGHFIINGGAISGNSTARIGGGIRNQGANAVLNMHGGEISGNISVGDAGGGITNMGGATFRLYDGKISGNTSMVFSGGGVNNQASDFVMAGGEISGNIASSGAGVLNWSNATFTLEGGAISANITTAAEGRGGGVFNFGPATFVMRGGRVTDHTTASYGGGINSTGDDAFVSIEGGTISGNTAIVDGGGIWIAYENLTNLLVGVDAVFSGNSASKAYNRNPANDELYFTHILGTRWTSPFTQGYNNFDISYSNGTPFVFPADVNLQGIKNAVGAPLPGGFFVFGVFDQSGSRIVTATADADGGIIFPAITFSAPGIFNFTIREITPTGSGWLADTSVFRVTVTVTDSGEGRLITTIDYPDGFPSFTNTFIQPESETAIVTIRAQKRVCGACLRAGCFVFGLFDKNCKEVARASNDENGNIAFPALAFHEPGVHCYRIRELGFSNSCRTTDKRIYTALLIITRNSAGQIIATAKYPNGQPVFVNFFCCR